MRSILIHADRGPEMPARLETGLSLARSFGGHVTVLIDTPIQRYVAMDPLGGSYVATGALNQALEQDRLLAEDIEAQLGRQDVPFDIILAEVDVIEALVEASRLADLVVVPRIGDLAGELALAARTPVLVLPGKGRLSVPPERAIVAWDGGDEAALALRSAVPLLRGCSQVEVVAVTVKPGGFPATGAMSYLSRHGIKAELREVIRKGSTGETLAVEVARTRAELLVMGAYGKSRMREFLFGGVTRFFLEESTNVALLLAH
jgi:nucleotide-binding universal stress UspA family protein